MSEKESAEAHVQEDYPRYKHPMSDFVHLHVHSDYSLLDGAAKITKPASRARAQRFLHERRGAIFDRKNGVSSDSKTAAIRSELRFLAQRSFKRNQSQERQKSRQRLKLACPSLQAFIAVAA